MNKWHILKLILMARPHIWKYQHMATLVQTSASLHNTFEGESSVYTTHRSCPLSGGDIHCQTSGGGKFRNKLWLFQDPTTINPAISFHQVHVSLLCCLVLCLLPWFAMCFFFYFLCSMCFCCLSCLWSCPCSPNSDVVCIFQQMVDIMEWSHSEYVDTSSRDTCVTCVVVVGARSWVKKR